MANSKNQIKSVLTDKKALVLGSSGQDGSLICKSLLKKGYKVIGFSRAKSNYKGNLALLGIEKECEIQKGNIEDFETIYNLVKKYNPHTIYNLAAQSSVGKSFINPAETIQSIINGSHNILEVARKLKYDGKIFFAGSSEIYGNTAQAASIDDKHELLSPYAIGKGSMFNLVKLYRNIYKINCMTGVLFNHESPYRPSNFVTQKIIKGAIKCKLNKSQKLNLGNINISRDWGWAEEYVEAIQLITNANKVEDQIICTGKLTKLRDFIRIVFNKLNLNWKDFVIEDKTLFRKAEIEKSYGNPSKLYKDLGWKSQNDIENIIEKLIEFQLKLK